MAFTDLLFFSLVLLGSLQNSACNHDLQIDQQAVSSDTDELTQDPVQKPLVRSASAAHISPLQRLVEHILHHRDSLHKSLKPSEPLHPQDDPHADHQAVSSDTDGLIQDKMQKPLGRSASAAFRDMEQRMVDPFEYLQPRDSLQRPLKPSDPLYPEGFEQRIVDLPGSFLHRDLMQRPLDSSEFISPEERAIVREGVQQLNMEDVQPFPDPNRIQFPLSRPTSLNIEAICLHADHRPRYPDSYFPNSGYSKMRRKAAAVNNAENWFRTCCDASQKLENDTVLCCATQAWELSLNLFCEEDSSVKDWQEVCCGKRGMDRMSCFNENVPNPNYEATEELPVLEVPTTASFTFHPNACPRQLKAPPKPRASKGHENNSLQLPASQEVAINFPLGYPTIGNIELLCHFEKYRPRYTTKCLPHSGYEVLKHQAKSVDRLEKKFKKCCKNKAEALSCTEQKWLDEMKHYCSKSTQTPLPCCSPLDQESQLTCFKTASPDPYYFLTSSVNDLVLDKLCHTSSMRKRRLPGFLKASMKECCHLTEDKTSCLVEKLGEASLNLCSTKQTEQSYSSPTGICCMKSSLEDVSECVTRIAKSYIPRADHLKSKKKICPLS